MRQFSAESLRPARTKTSRVLIVRRDASPRSAAMETGLAAMPQPFRAVFGKADLRPATLSGTVVGISKRSQTIPIPCLGRKTTLQAKSMKPMECLILESL